jgi:hypothetical protein
MKKEILVSIILLILAININLVSASECNINVQMINQDPYPVMPGEYVKVVFQVTGVELKNCDYFYMELVENYPFSLDPGVSPNVEIFAGTFTKDYESYLMVPYTIRVDKSAIQGYNELAIKFKTSKNSNVYNVKKFNIKLEEVDTDFELFIRDYDYSRRTITFEILNHGKNNAESLRLEIPKQENIIIKGSPVSIIGALDSNDFTTTSFEAIPSEGEIKANIYYKDINDNQRVIEKSVYFEPDYFQDRLRDEKQQPTWIYGVLVIVVLIIVYIIYRKYKKSKKKKLLG